MSQSVTPADQEIWDNLPDLMEGASSATGLVIALERELKKKGFVEIRENNTLKVRSMRSFADMQIAFQNLSRHVNTKALICA
jgi:hypothetical protein